MRKVYVSLVIYTIIVSVILNLFLPMIVVAEIDNNTFEQLDKVRDARLLAMASPYKRDFTNSLPKSEELERDIQSEQEGYIVQFNDKVEIQRIFDILNKYDFKIIGNSNMKIFLIYTDNFPILEKQVGNLVEFIEKNDLIMVLNDSSQEPSYDSSLNELLLNLLEIKNKKAENELFKVALIDSGFESDQSYLLHVNLLSGWDYISKVIVERDLTGNETIKTIDVANKLINGLENYVVSSDIAFIPMKVIASSGAFYLSDSISAIYDAVDLGCEVIRSLSSNKDSISESTALEYASSKGCVVISANNEVLSSISYPQLYSRTNNEGIETNEGVESSLSGINEVDSVTLLEDISAPKIVFDSETGTIREYISSGETIVVIPSEINGVTVKNIGANAFYGYGYNTSNNVITSITIPDTVITIGSNAFNGCKNLSSITIPSNVTSIGFGAFYGCSSLTNVTLPEVITKIEGYTFSECSSLTNIVIPQLVTSIGFGAFYGCSSLYNISIPDSVTNIGEVAFSRCSSLSTISIPDSVTKIERDTFFGCSQLISITLPEYLTSIGARAFEKCSSITDIRLPELITKIERNTFSDCSSLININIPELVTAIDIYAFSNCSSLPNIIIPNTVNNLGGSAFWLCSSLNSITLPDSINSIDSGLFYGCSSLSSVRIPEEVTSIGAYAFTGCSSLTNVIIPDRVTSIGDAAFFNCSGLVNFLMPEYITSISSSVFSGCRSLRTISIPESVTSVGSYAFNSCSSLESIDIPSGVLSIGEQVFCGCSSLTSIILPNKVTSISKRMFSGCYNLQSVLVPNGVTSIGDMAFAICHALTSIVLPISVTSIGESAFYNCQFSSFTIPNNVKTIGKGAFKDCMKLVSINIPEGVSYIGNSAFYNCRALPQLTLPSSLKSIEEETFAYCSSLTRINFAPSGISSIASSSFRFCGNLTNITLPESVTSIGSFAFANCYNLLNITIPKNISNIGEAVFYDCESLVNISIPMGVTSIGDSAFERCIKLTNVSLPESLMHIGDKSFYYCNGIISITIPLNVLSIGEYAFSNCYSLKNISISNKLTEINDFAFDFCNNITDLYYYGCENDWNKIVFGASNNYLKNATIHYSNPLKYYTATFDLSFGNNSKYTQQCVTSGSNITNPINPVRDGYTFAGWYTNSRCVGLDFFNNLNHQERQNVSGNLTLYAKWIEDTELGNSDNGFGIPKDVFSFTNTGNDFCFDGWDNLTENQKFLYYQQHDYNIMTSDFKALLDLANLSTKIKLWKEKNEIWQGSCFGMSSVVSLVAAGEIPIEKYDAQVKFTNSLSDLRLTKNSEGDKDVGNVESLINYYQLAQFLPGIDRIVKDFSIPSESDNLKAIVGKMSISSHPVIIAFALLNSSLAPISEHGVVGYDMQYDALNSVYSIKIYDCSLGNSSYHTLTIYENNGLFTKECTDYIDAWNESSSEIRDFLIESAVSVEDLINVVNNDSVSLFESVEEQQLYHLNTNYNSFKISNSSSHALVEKGQRGEGDLEILILGPQNEIGSKQNFLYHIKALNPGEAYVIEPLLTDEQPNYRTEMSFDSAANGFYSSIDAEASGKITIGCSGEIFTEFDSDTKQTLGTTRCGTETSWYYTEISGCDTGFYMIPSLSQISIKSNNSTTVSVNILEDLEMIVLDDIAIDSNGISIVENEDRICSITNEAGLIKSTEIGYTVIFDSQYGSAISSIYSVIPGMKITKPTSNPERAGYLFMGWFREASCLTTWDFEADTINSHTILYAKWEVDPDYVVSITFRANNCDDQIIYTSKGSSISSESLPTIPNRVGFVTLGWETVNLISVQEDLIIHGLYNGVSNVDFVDNVAHIDFENANPCYVILAIYDSSGKLIDIGMKAREKSDNTEEIIMNTSIYPSEFMSKVFLLDNSNMAPTCSAFSKSFSH